MTKFVDVIVVGGGGAACRAAIEAADIGAKVAVIVKGKLGQSGATAYKVAEMAGFNVADSQGDIDDSPEEHYRDIMAAAYGMADPQLARLVAEEAPLALETLSNWGVVFERDGDRYLVFQSCFSTRPRTHVIKGHGEPIIKALLKEIRKRDIVIFEDSYVTNLFLHEGECIGAGFLDKYNEYRVLPAGAVVVATGGAGQLFARNLNPTDICGDGYLLGYEAGAELINMEFMQAGLGISYPVDNILNAWIWSAFPILVNEKGEEFLDNYLPDSVTKELVMEAHAQHFPFSSADYSRYIEISVQQELARGHGTKEGGVYLDLTKVTDDYLAALPPGSAFRKMWPITREFLLARGVNVAKERVQIACFGHAINGGIRIDARGRSTVPGLYAAGEVAGGPHGADRLGGNMMVTCQVFGARAGRSAALEAEQKGRVEIPLQLAKDEEARLRGLLQRRINVSELKEELQEAAQKHLLVRRNEEGLKEFLATVQGIREEISRGQEGNADRGILELRSLLAAGEVMATAALARRESRGSHYRADHPERNDEQFGSPYVITCDSKGRPELKTFVFGDK